MNNSKQIYCSFCGKPAEAVKFIMCGEKAQICDECTVSAVVILDHKFDGFREVLTSAMDKNTALHIAAATKSVIEDGKNSLNGSQNRVG